MSSGFNFDEEVLLQALRNIYRKKFNATEDIEPHLFHEFTEIFNQAADEGFSQSVEPDEEFRKALRHNNAVFAAFKTHRMQNDMAAQLLDSNGNLKPFEQWRNDVQSIASHQCRSWLETEYNTAVLRAHQAADWQQFLQEADVLPNLKWMPSTSPNPGADHMPFWGTILPIDDPFWDQHRPGDRWNCKCSLTSTDEPTTPVPSVAVSQQPKNTPQRGLENNPGKDAAHKAVEKAVKKAENKEMKIALRKAVQGQSISNPQFPHQILVSRASIDEWVNQPFKYMEEKAQMLFDIQNVIKKAKYLGPADKHKEIDRLIQSHIFKTKVKDMDAYIIVHEYSDGKYILHSISDSPKILEFLKRK